MFLLCIHKKLQLTAEIIIIRIYDTLGNNSGTATTQWDTVEKNIVIQICNTNLPSMDFTAKNHIKEKSWVSHSGIQN